MSGQFVVFAATNDADVNGRVMLCCRRRRILCSAVDAHWTEGDFVTPAIIRQPDLTLTVSTGGQSCRRARIVKDTLARHLDLIGSAELLAVCVAPQRACRSDAAAVRTLGAMLRHVWGVHEFMILQTPRRLHLLAVVSRDAAVERLLARILVSGPGQGGPSRARRGPGALAHLVTLYVGEGSPRGMAASIRTALDRATRYGWAGVMMKEWTEAALQLAERSNACEGSKAAAHTACRVTGECRKQYDRILRGLQGRNPVE